MSLELCDKYNECCSTILDNPGTDRRPGRIDKYTDLGDCSSRILNDVQTATLSKDGNDGWGVSWTNIRFTNGYVQTCTFNTWLDNEAGSTRTKTVECKTTTTTASTTSITTTTTTRTTMTTATTTSTTTPTAGKLQIVLKLLEKCWQIV